jgi:hypothetical protein
MVRDDSTAEHDDATDPLMNGDAWADFCDRLRAIGEVIRGDGYPDTPRERAEGYRWLTRLLAHAISMEIEAGDPRFPRFVRYETPGTQWGGPNPDNTYLRATVDPGESYRVWANVSGVRQAIVSLHEGEMHFGELGVYGERSLDELEIGPDGGLEIVLSADSHPGNWIRMPPEARLFLVRIYSSDWVHDAAPVFHIERIGAEGVPPPPLEPERMTRALDRSATWVEKSARFWNTYTRHAWERSRPNTPAPPRPAPGGADHILYGSCCWELGDDEALLLECDVPDADYWGFTLHTLGWLESGDFAERQTSLSDRQIHVDDDGRLRVVVAHRDPGTPNWIDTGERRRGLLVYRWVWARTSPAPSASVVRLDQLRDALPAGHPLIPADERRRSLARRRESAWNRFV